VAGPPTVEPIGLEVARTAKVLSRAFDEALGAGGGSLPTWLVLVSLMAQSHGRQRDLADAVGIESATLTHHLNRMEAAGLLTRRRDPENRRVHQVELTDSGEATFHALRNRAADFDEQLRTGFTDSELAQLRGFLDRLRANASKGGSR
jgi:MarR family transcriptional regulator, transcriptional regulator for hemolysin